jgi:origin recognition complex subunit 5
MDPKTTLASLEQQWPGRESLVSSLHALWSTYPPPFIHIYDPTTAIITEKLLSDLLHLVQTHSGLLSVHIDATECITPKLLFDRILNGLADWIPKWEDGALNWISTLGERYTENLDGFIHALQALHQRKSESENQKGPNIVILVSKAERLKESLPNIVTPLARLADLVRDSVHL